MQSNRSHNTLSVPIETIAEEKREQAINKAEGQKRDAVGMDYGHVMIYNFEVRNDAVEFIIAV